VVVLFTPKYLDQEFVEEKFKKLYEMAKMESKYREEFGVDIQ